MYKDSMIRGRTRRVRAGGRVAVAMQLLGECGNLKTVASHSPRVVAIVAAVLGFYSLDILTKGS